MTPGEFIAGAIVTFWLLVITPLGLIKFFELCSWLVEHVRFV